MIISQGNCIGFKHKNHFKYWEITEEKTKVPSNHYEKDETHTTKRIEKIFRSRKKKIIF